MLVPPWPALTGSFGSPVTKTPTQPISHCFNPGTTKGLVLAVPNWSEEGTTGRRDAAKDAIPRQSIVTPPGQLPAGRAAAPRISKRLPISKTQCWDAGDEGDGGSTMPVPPAAAPSSRRLLPPWGAIPRTSGRAGPSVLGWSSGFRDSRGSFSAVWNALSF